MHRVLCDFFSITRTGVYGDSRLTIIHSFLVSLRAQLKELNADATAAFDGASSAMEFAFKSKGLSAEMFPAGSAAPAAKETPKEVS